MDLIPLTLKERKQEERIRQEEEGERLFNRRLLLHNFDQGQPTSLTIGQPGSCKTAVTCTICEYFMNKHPTDYLFWRSALNAPLQFLKLPKWHIFVEKDSGIRFFHSKSGTDITEQLQNEKKLTYFKNFDELYRKAKQGICNGIFFKDLHKKNIKKDNGTLQWFKFIRYLLSKFAWCQVFLDEYQEMVKAYQSGDLWKAIDSHGDDVTEGRKTRVGIHGNCHDISYQLDHRVIPGFMIFIQLYGASVIRNKPVNKKALSSIPEPNERDGAVGWISEGNRYGRLKFEKIYKLSEEQSITARIISSYEKTKVCPVCNDVFVYDRIDTVYCSQACMQKAHRIRNGQLDERKPLSLMLESTLITT